MTFCNCLFPKKLKNTAHGKVFYVCAKSKGGCGEEISDLIWTGNPLSSQGASITPEMVEEACMKALMGNMGYDPGGQDKTIVSQINPHLKKSVIECPCCYGTGSMETIFHNGITRQEACMYCDGIGQVQI